MSLSQACRVGSKIRKIEILSPAHSEEEGCVVREYIARISWKKTKEAGWEFEHEKTVLYDQTQPLYS